MVRLSRLEHPSIGQQIVYPFRQVLTKPHCFGNHNRQAQGMTALLSIQSAGEYKGFAGYVSFDLAPDIAPGGSAHTDPFLNRAALFLGNQHIVVNGESAAFHDCPQDVGAIGFIGKAEEHATGIVCSRIGVRSPAM